MLLQHIAWSLACHHLGEALPAQCHLDLPALVGEGGFTPIPVFLEARWLADRLQNHGANPRLAPLLVEVFDDEATKKAVREGLRQCRYLLLVDALDEVPDPAQREQVLQLLQGAAQSCRCRIVLTTRPTAHTGVRLVEPFQRIDIAPLHDDRRQALIDRWQAAEHLPEAAVKQLPGALAELQHQFRGDPVAQSPLANPLLLTAVLLVFVSQERLPDNLADLYERMVRHLCDRAELRGAGRAEDRLTALGDLLQHGGGTALPVRTLAQGLVARGFHPHENAARNDIDQLAAATGLLRFETQGGQTVVRPWHRSFQEYLAARHIAERSGGEADIVKDLHAQKRLTDPSWEGCLRFMVGVFGQHGPARAEGAVQALVELAQGAPAIEEGRLYGLAAAGVVEYHQEYFAQARIATHLGSEVAEAYAARGAQWPWRDRLLAWNAVGRLPGGDPRLPDPHTSRQGWVYIPGGTTQIGGDPKAFRSLRAMEVTTPALWMRALAGDGGGVSGVRGPSDLRRGVVVAGGRGAGA